MADPTDAKPQAPNPDAAPGSSAPVPFPVSPPTSGPAELREDEEALEDAKVMELVSKHKTKLEQMPDTPRPPAPGTSRPSWRRRTYVVDWKLQLSYAGLYVATITLFVVGFAASNSIFMRLHQTVQLNARVPAPDQQSDVAFFLVLNFVILLFIGMGMALWAIVQSNRVAGPALRFRRAFRQIRRRDYDFFLQLRKNDFLKDLAVELNVLNHALKAKDLVLTDIAMRVDVIARAAIEPANASELHEISQELADLVLPLPEPPTDAPPATASVPAAVGTVAKTA